MAHGLRCEETPDHRLNMTLESEWLNPPGGLRLFRSAASYIVRV